MEVVHFDELVQVDGQHLERDDQVLPEDKLVQPFDDVLLVLRIVIIQMLHELGLNQSLLIQPLLVLQDLQRHVHLFLVVIAPQDLAKRTLPNLLGDLVPVSKVLIESNDVFILISIKSVVSLLIKHAHLAQTMLSHRHAIILLLFPLLNIKVEHLLVFKYLPLLHIPQIRTQYLECLVCCHRETGVYVAGGCAVLFQSQRAEFRVD